MGPCDQYFKLSESKIVVTGVIYSLLETWRISTSDNTWKLEQACILIVYIVCTVIKYISIFFKMLISKQQNIFSMQTSKRNVLSSVELLIDLIKKVRQLKFKRKISFILTHSDGVLYITFRRTDHNHIDHSPFKDEFTINL